ncbi:MAG: Orn/Lys/Arg decarboxylase N-terminal domain-containing protein [Bacillota bacterium]
MTLYKNFPVLIVDNRIKADNIEGRALKRLIDCLLDRGLAVIESGMDEYDQNYTVLAESEVGCVLLGWNKVSPYRLQRVVSRLEQLIDLLRKRNLSVPVFLMTDKLNIKDIPVDTLSKINGYIWKMEDTPDFIAGRIENAVRQYLDSLLPPFFRALVKYAGEYKYAWHTPGHMGGTAYLKSPTGRVFHSFYGENVFRSDLSVSVPELGSLLEHTLVINEAEANASRIFGADRTYFVTNGTSTSNKIVLQGTVNRGDIVLVDRNCHKSVMHAVILTGAIPIYLGPTRNKYGIIGPLSIEELSAGAIKKKMAESPFISRPPGKVKLTVITNSTYDGICHNVKIIMERLKQNGTGLTENFLFDEAWFAHAAFNPIYRQRHAACRGEKDSAFNLVFATQSTHKLLAAFSQASMIHVVDQRGDFCHDRFNEAFMMHSSTSPQYGIIASLDVAAKMMEGGFGLSATQSAIEEAIIFRKKMSQTGRELKESGDWWFDVWQPPVVGGVEFDRTDDQALNTDPSCWELKPEDQWHGFDKLIGGYAMLDPIKVTVLTPGIDNNRMDPGQIIPAPVVSRFLTNRGIVAEKTGFYSILLLFSVGVTTGKSGTLLSVLFEFKRAYDKDLSLAEVFPDLAGLYPPGATIRTLCREMHSFLAAAKYFDLLKMVYDSFPEQMMTPADAYRELVAGNVRRLKLQELPGKTAAVMVVPYPPGIPVIMPGEKFNPLLVEYLQFYETFEKHFPGFDNEVHGMKKTGGAYTVYAIDNPPG